MAHSIFTTITALRIVLDTETDSNSPDNETTYNAMRVMIEALYQLGYDTGVSGTASEDPPNDTTGVLTDSGASFGTDEHNGRTLLITSGLAVGNIYTIDDTASTTLTCTGDNLYSDGVKSGDDYRVLYDIKTNTDGHDHDGVNSRQVVAPTGRTPIVNYHLGTTLDPGGTLATAMQWKIYVPNNPSTIKCYLDVNSKSVGRSILASLEFIDSNSCAWYSSTVNNGAGDWDAATLSVSATAAAEGLGTITIRVGYGTSAGEVAIRRPALYWQD